jgi:hypothetical protein
MVFIFKFANKRNKNKKLTLKRLLQVLYIDPEAGECRWKVAKARRIKVGSRAGTVLKTPKSNDLYYRQIQIDDKIYYEHILIWFFVTKKWPVRDLDHKNRDGLDNRFKNLRLATDSQNHGNNKTSKNNSSGYKGVFFSKRDKKWFAQIGYKRKRIRSKGFHNPEGAYQWYCIEHKKLFGDFSRTV